jgi:uncharacterized protein with HEPN domain
MTPVEQVRLRHALGACDKVLPHSGGRTAELDTDELYSLAIVRLLEVIAEAVKSVGQPSRDATPHIAWRQIGRTRDRLIHGYFNIDMDIVWQIVTNDVPTLRTQLGSLLASP